ncbi:MAG: dipeptide/oligopeptide/nickel ABC transporter ATP-binding protein [Nitrososphaera sp.]
MDVLLEARNLIKYFPIKKSFRQLMQRSGQDFVRAVDDVSFTLERGKVLVIAGESGSGKTTVARLVMRAADPDGGSIIFEGNDVTRYTGGQLADFRTAVHMVYQDPYASLNPRMKIMDIVMEPLNIHDRASSKEKKVEKVLAALREVRLEPAEEIAAKYPHMLSGGQRQRVAIARALMNDPAIILADEPTGNLDTKTGQEVFDLLKMLSSKFRRTIIMVTHNSELAQATDRAIFIRDGMVEKEVVFRW